MSKKPTVEVLLTPGDLVNLYNTCTDVTMQMRSAAMTKQMEGVVVPELISMHENYFSKTYGAIIRADETRDDTLFYATVLESKDFVVCSKKTAYFAVVTLMQWFKKVGEITKNSFHFPNLLLDFVAFDRVVTYTEYQRAQTLSFTPFTPFLLISALRLLSFQTARTEYFKGMYDYLSEGTFKDNIADIASALAGGVSRRSVEKLEAAIVRKNKIITEQRDKTQVLIEENKKLKTLEGCTDEELEQVKAALRKRGFIIIDTNANILSQVLHHTTYLATETEWSSLWPGGSENATFTNVDTIHQNLVLATGFAETARFEHLCKIEEGALCLQCGEKTRTHAIVPCGCFKYCADCVKTIQPSKRKSRCPSCKVPSTGAMEIKM